MSENYIFMNLDSFDQFNVPIIGLEDRRYYLLDGETYQIIFTFLDKNIIYYIISYILYLVIHI